MSTMRGAVLLLATTLLAACGGPSRQDYAELIALEVPELGDIDVTRTAPTGTGWTRMEGRAVLTEDLIDRLDPSDIAGLCGAGLAGTRAAVGDLAIVELVAGAGTPVVFSYETVPERAEAGEDPERITSGGWTTGTWGGDYRLEGESRRARGFRRSWYASLDGAVFTGTPAFDAVCEAARAR